MTAEPCDFTKCDGPVLVKDENEDVDMFPFDEFSDNDRSYVEFCEECGGRCIYANWIPDEPVMEENYEPRDAVV